MNARWQPGVLLAGMGMLAGAQAAPPPASQQVTLVCAAQYQPAGETWVRTVQIDFDEQRIRGVRIDGTPVYRFAVEGTVLATALDNERIRIGTDALTWQSDFRGLAQSQGRCERRP